MYPSSKPPIACSELTLEIETETLKQGVKYVQS